MEKRLGQKIGLWQFCGFAIVSLLGTLLHFLYDWTGENRFAALFSGVNESTWEHMKLLFFPLLLFAVAEGFFLGTDLPNFWSTKLKGTLLGLLLIPALFYTLNGTFGKTPDFINIAIFFVSAAAAFLYETRIFLRGELPPSGEKLSRFAFLGLSAAFFLFTFCPPMIPLFQDPLSGSYGI